MSNNKKEESSKENTKPKKRSITITLNNVLSFVAYIGIGCIAFALLLTLIFKGNTKLSVAFSSIGEVIAYVICICLAFLWVKKNKSIPWIVFYVIFVVTIVVLYILNF